MLAAWTLMAVAAAQQEAPVRLMTPSGVPFAMLGAKTDSPAPTLFQFAADAALSLEGKLYPLGVALRKRHGFLVVSLDVPGHGADRRPGEPASIAAWRSRIEKGEDIAATFASRVRQVLDFLVEQRYTDPRRVYVAGTSRGAFAAFHVASADPRFRAVIAFAPVTDLNALAEFSGMAENRLVRSLGVHLSAERLAGRSLWICIGNNDNRVGTDLAIDLARRVVRSAVAKNLQPDVELIVQSTKGHTIADDSAERAASWIADRLNISPANQPVQPRAHQ
jgi:dienelactone hydrolase